MTKHKQVDTSLGFKCDVGILDLIVAMNDVRLSIATEFSCQQIDRHHSGFKWPKSNPHGYVLFKSNSQSMLMYFCHNLRYFLPNNIDTNEINIEIIFDSWTKSFGPRGYIAFSNKPKIIKALTNTIVKMASRI